MEAEQNGKPPRMNGGQVAQVIFGVVVFGVLMGFRQEFHSMWVRMLVAACAGAVLGIFVILPARRRS